MRKCDDFGFITGIIRWVLNIGSDFPSRFFLGKRSELKLPKAPSELLAYARSRSIKVELYICAWITIEMACFALCFVRPIPKLISIVVIVLMTLRIAEICLSNIDMGIFRVAGNPTVAQILRILVLITINYSELWLCFAALYGVNLSYVKNAADAWDAAYFSGVTQLTIGYGDLLPLGWLRLLVLVQGWIGTMFLLLILGRLIAAMPLLQELRANQPIPDERLEGDKV